MWGGGGGECVCASGFWCLCSKRRSGMVGGRERLIWLCCVCVVNERWWLGGRLQCQCFFYIGQDFSPPPLPIDLKDTGDTISERERETLSLRIGSRDVRPRVCSLELRHTERQTRKGQGRGGGSCGWVRKGGHEIRGLQHAHTHTHSSVTY